MTFEVPALAAGFASQFESIGPYVGFGSLIAVVAMAVLVFSQGRELQRLREWAGTSPERLTALEQQLEGEQRVAARPVAPGAPVPGTLARHPGAPVGAAAAAAGPTAVAGAAAPPMPPVPGANPPVPAGAAAATAAGGAAAGAVAGAAATPGGPPRPVPPTPAVPLAAGGSQATRVVPALGAGNGPGPTPRAASAAGRASTAARQRQAPEPAPRSVAQIIGVVVVLGIVLVGVLFAVGVIGGGDNTDLAATNETDRKALVEDKPKAPTYSAGQTSVVVLNASGQPGLAKTASDLLDNKRFATGAAGNYSEGNVPVYKPTSTVTYRAGRGNKDAARDIAKHLKLKSTSVKPMTEEIKLSVDGTPKIVVILGQDYVTKVGETPADVNPNGTTSTGSTATTDPSAGTTPGATGTDGSGAATTADPAASGAVDDGTGTPVQ